VSAPTEVDDTGAHALPVERNELKSADDVGFALAGALQTWCATRDPRRLRRELLVLLSDLEDE
jgi:hypothetical protein